MRAATRLAILFPVLALFTGCSGGWRNGAPPGSSASSTASSTSRASASAGAQGTASAENATFKWTGGGNEVFLAGEFNEWNATAEKMTKQPDGSFTITRTLAPGKYQYKFVVDGTWKSDPNAKETVDDPFGGKNSLIVIGGGAAAAAPPSPSPTPAAGATGNAASAAGKAPQVTAEGVRFTFGGAAQSVAIAGDFNQWAINADPLTKQTDGTWTIVKSLPPGRYAYKFVVNGTVWKHDDANPESVDDGFGGKNSIVDVK